MDFVGSKSEASERKEAVLVRTRSAEAFIPSASTWTLLLSLTVIVVLLAELFTAGVTMDTTQIAMNMVMLGASTLVFIGTGLYKATTFAQRRS